MPRTTPTAVAGIISVDAGLDLNPFIEVASSLVTEWCAPGISDSARLEMIERYLAAHLYGLRDQQVQSEAAGGASATYQGKTDFFLEGTQYGQTAILLDSTGNLARINKRLPIQPGLFWAGSNKTTCV